MILFLWQYKFFFCNTFSAGAVKKSLVHLKKRCSVNIQTETLNYPIESAEEIVELVERTLDGKKTKLALFDHIPSQMAFTMPIKKIVQVCHKKFVFFL